MEKYKFHYAEEVEHLCQKLQNETENEINVFSWMSTNKLDRSEPITFNFECSTSLVKTAEYDVSPTYSSGSVELIEERNDENLDITIQEIEKNVMQIQEILNGTEKEDIANLFPIMSEISLNKINDVCECLHLEKLQDITYYNFIHEFVKCHKTMGYATITTIINFIFSRKIQPLNRSLSQIEMMAALQLTETFPNEIIDGIMWIIKNGQIGNFQSGIFGRLIKEKLKDKTEHLLKEFLKINHEWDDFSVVIIQNIVDIKVQWNDQTVTLFLESLSNRAINFKKNLKFAKLLQIFILNFGQQCSANHISILEKIISVNETFLKKTLENILKRLK